jgi:hypothetical protein
MSEATPQASKQEETTEKADDMLRALCRAIRISADEAAQIMAARVQRKSPG